MQIITKFEAKEQGFKEFYTGKPCKYNHDSPRRVDNGDCTVCAANRSAKYYSNNVLKHKQNGVRNHLKRTYGLTLEDMKELLELQNNRCVTCLTEFVTTPHVDHCHTTGRIRGLLCGCCNRSLGLLKENPETLRRMMDYIT